MFFSQRTTAPTAPSPPLFARLDSTVHTLRTVCCVHLDFFVMLEASNPPVRPLLESLQSFPCVSFLTASQHPVCCCCHFLSFLRLPSACSVFCWIICVSHSDSLFPPVPIRNVCLMLPPLRTPTQSATVSILGLVLDLVLFFTIVLFWWIYLYLQHRYHSFFPCLSCSPFP